VDSVRFPVQLGTGAPVLRISPLASVVRSCGRAPASTRLQYGVHQVSFFSLSRLSNGHQRLVVPCEPPTWSPCATAGSYYVHRWTYWVSEDSLPIFGASRTRRRCIYHFPRWPWAQAHRHGRGPERELSGDYQFLTILHKEA